MSLQVEKLEKNMAKLTVQVPFELVDKAMNLVYNRQKGKIAIPGFRKGKAPRRMIERVYGKGIFLEDAINDLLPEEYDKAVEESGLEVVSRPKIDFVQTEPDQDLIFTAQVATKPEVTLGQYTGIEVPKTVVEVTDEEIDAEIRKEQEKNARTVTVEGREAENGDIVTIDYAGTIDGVAFEGGTGENHPLTLGSGSFIPGFEEQLVGVIAGDQVDVKVTFPQNYHEASIAGKDAVFACNVRKVETKELPELDDDFAQDVSEAETFEEYRQSVKDEIQKRKEDEAHAAKENAAIAGAVKNAELDIPDAMIDFQVENMLDDFSSRMSMQGLTVEQYAQYTGQSVSAIQEQMRPNAIERIRTRLVLEKVAQAEGLTATDEEVDAEIEKMAAAYRMELEDARKSFNDRQLEQIRKDIEVGKAADFITNAAAEV